MSYIEFQKFFESAPSLFLVLSPKFEIVAVSDTYLSATKTKRNEIVGRDMFEVFPDNPDDPNADGTRNLGDSLRRVLKTGLSDRMPIQKYDIKRPASEGGGFQEKYWSPTNYPILDNDNKVKYIIHHVEDVTDFVRVKQEGIKQHQLTEELRSQAETMEKIRQSQRLEAMGQLAGGIAHDFNNILAVIIMNCDVMLDQMTLTEPAKRSFEQIRKTSERAALLTRQLLAFSRNQVLQPRPLNLNVIIAEMEAMLQRLLNEDIVLETKLDEKLGNTLADQGQIEQIILNLLVNAKDALPKGGKITITTSNEHLAVTKASGAMKAEPGEYVRLSVKDNGFGMDAKTQARVFEPFFTTKSVGKGTGLGLATVYGIVSQNRGIIWVESAPLKGTAFEIYLPLVNQVAEKVESKEPEPISLTGTEKILVVEDEVEIRKLICSNLKSHGYTVFEAENGSKALNLIQENPDAFDLVVTDVVMPEVGGRALAEKLSHINSAIKLLYLSGYTEDVLVNYGISGSHPHFLEKPFTLNALLKKIRSILA